VNEVKTDCRAKPKQSMHRSLKKTKQIQDQRV